MTATIAPPTITSLDVAKAISDGADLLERGGWTHRTFTKADASEACGWRHCAGGWIAVAIRGDDITPQQYVAGDDVSSFRNDDGTVNDFESDLFHKTVGVLDDQCLSEHSGYSSFYGYNDGYSSFYGYNDGQRDKRKVIRFMRRAAHRLVSGQVTVS